MFYLQISLHIVSLFILLSQWDDIVNNKSHAYFYIYLYILCMIFILVFRSFTRIVKINRKLLKVINGLSHISALSIFLILVIIPFFMTTIPNMYFYFAISMLISIFLYDIKS